MSDESLKPDIVDDGLGDTCERLLRELGLNDDHFWLAKSLQDLESDKDVSQVSVYPYAELHRDQAHYSLAGNVQLTKSFASQETFIEWAEQRGIVPLAISKVRLGYKVMAPGGTINFLEYQSPPEKGTAYIRIPPSA